MTAQGQNKHFPTKLGIVEEKMMRALDPFGFGDSLKGKLLEAFGIGCLWCPETWGTLSDNALLKIGLSEEDLKKWRERYPKYKAMSAVISDLPLDVHITIMGDTQVGKSCTVQKLLYNAFHTDLPPTVESTSFFGPNENEPKKDSCKVSWCDGEFKGQIVDTAGKGDLRIYLEQWFVNSEILVYLFDVTNIHTLDGLEKLRNQEIESKKRKGRSTEPCLVVANKIDLWEGLAEATQRKIEDKLKRMLDSENFNHCLFLESSAKDFEKNILEKLLLQNCCLMKLVKEIDDDPDIWESNGNKGGNNDEGCCTIS